jgi:hypothetical protein
MWRHVVWYQTPTFYSSPLPQSSGQNITTQTRSWDTMLLCFGLDAYILWQYFRGCRSILKFVFIVCSMSMLTPLTRNSFWALLGQKDCVPCSQSVSASSHCPHFTICERFVQSIFPLNCVRSERVLFKRSGIRKTLLLDVNSSKSKGVGCC